MSAGFQSPPLHVEPSGCASTRVFAPGMARFNSANASYAESYLLVTILAAVLGGVDPMGGFGKIAGLVLSLIILQVISSAFNLLNFSQFLTLAIWGTILVAVMAVPNIRKRLGLAN